MTRLLSTVALAVAAFAGVDAATTCNPPWSAPIWCANPPNDVMQHIQNACWGYTVGNTAVKGALQFVSSTVFSRCCFLQIVLTYIYSFGSRSPMVFLLPCVWTLAATGSWWCRFRTIRRRHVFLLGTIAMPYFVFRWVVWRAEQWRRMVGGSGEFFYIPWFECS
jgi:hypothetical protein